MWLKDLYLTEKLNSYIENHCVNDGRLSRKAEGKLQLLTLRDLHNISDVLGVKSNDESFHTLYTYIKTNCTNQGEIVWRDAGLFERLSIKDMRAIRDILKNSVKEKADEYRAEPEAVFAACEWIVAQPKEEYK